MMKSRDLFLLAIALIAFFVWISLQEVSPSQEASDSAPLRKKSPLTRSQTKDSRQAEDDEAPLFVLQVGPSKTGTSTLQYFTAGNAKLLEKDDMYYVGHFGHNRQRPEWDLHSMVSACYSCSGPNVPVCDEKWKEFEDIVNYHYSQNHSVLAVEEMFSAFQHASCEQEHLWDRLLPLLSKWRVRIVFNYRKYHEWVPSQYVQLYNPDGCGNSKRKIKNRQSWQDEGGKVIPPFPSFFEGFGENNVRQPPVISTKWKKHFNNVWVFNMHTEDFLQDFFCDMVPEAITMCRHLRQDHESVTRNPSTSKKLHFDMLATEAYERGWVDKKLSRNGVRDAVEQHAKSLGLVQVMDFPTVCLSPEQTDILLQRALTHESDLLPEFYASRGEALIKEEFAQAMAKGSFCSIDVNEVLKDRQWKIFFKNLDSAAMQADD